MLKFWELPPSPNNTKIRMALRFKGIPFDVVTVNALDRENVLKMSGQEATPVIEDKGIVLNDSEAILQYLDANYLDTPRLYPALKPGRRECDDWKTLIDQRLATAWAPIFFHVIGRREAPSAGEVEAFRSELAWLEDELGDKQSFKGDDKPVCDLRVAEWATYALPSEKLVARVRAFGRFRELAAIEKGAFPALRRFVAPWNKRLE